MTHREGGGLTPLSTSAPEVCTEATPATGLVRTPPSANLEAPGHIAQDLTQEKQALALLSIPSLAFNPHLRATPDTPLDHFTKALVIELRRFARSTGLQQRARQSADRLRYNTAIEALVCNLILAAVADTPHLTLWMDRESKAAKRWNGDCFGMPFRRAIDVMEGFGLMHLVQLGMRINKDLSLPSRFAIGDTFTDRWRQQQQGLLLLLDLSWIRDTRTTSTGANTKPLLVLKASKSSAKEDEDDDDDGDTGTADNTAEEIAFKETARTGEMRAQVARFNRILANETPIAIFNPDRIPILKHLNEEQQQQQQRQGRLALRVINPAARHLHRSFTHGSWDRGGRLHGGFWQMMHREDRYRFLRLGNTFSRHRARPGFAYEEVANCDYRQLYPRLAYTHLGMPVPDGDLYSIPGYEGGDCREGLKIIVSSMLFKRGPLKNWPRKALSCFPKGTILGEVKDAISIKHWPIHDLFEADGIGHHLVFLESQMLVRVLRHLYSAEVCVPALYLYDSVLVARSNVEVARVAMLSAFEKVTGVVLEKSWVSISP